MMEANRIPFEVLQRTEEVWRGVTGGSDSRLFTGPAFIPCLAACGQQVDEFV